MTVNIHTQVAREEAICEMSVMTVNIHMLVVRGKVICALLVTIAKIVCDRRQQERIRDSRSILPISDLI